jgi:hypothetical protein
MQNRYAGDVGDFGKLGLLRQLISSQLDIGVNWYLVPDESHNADGKHIGYITDTRYNGCDDSLRNSLKEIVNSQRSVSALEIEYTEVRNFAQGEEEWASHRDSATMDVA